MSDFQEYLWTGIAVVGLLILQLAVQFAKKKWNLQTVHADFLLALVAFAEREKDLFLAAIAEAKLPASDGGVIITVAEKDRILSGVWTRFISDDSIKKEVRDYATNQGVVVVKNLISKHIFKSNEIAVVPTPVV